MKAREEAYELRTLVLRIVELERERGEARDQARLLSQLQDAYARIAVTRAPDQIVHTMLRAAADPLEFGRGIFFGTDRELGIAARWQFDGNDTIEPSSDVPDLRPGSAILRALRGDVAQIVGCEGDLSAPLVDTRGWYVVTPLQHASGTLGVLYVDGHRNRAPLEWEIGLVRALATLSAVSLANAILFEATHALATRDPLTGLLNRRAFSEALLERIAGCAASRRTLTYVMLDVDDFKTVNDRYGHAHGDAVLQAVAATLTRNSRTRDLAGRYAGDEFVMLLEHDDVEAGPALVARLSEDLRSAGLRCSIGAAKYPIDAVDAETLARTADRALYVTKSAGKNGFMFA